MQVNSGDVKAWDRGTSVAWIWNIVAVIMVVQSYDAKYCRV